MVSIGNSDGVRPVVQERGVRGSESRGVENRRLSDYRSEDLLDSRQRWLRVSRVYVSLSVIGVYVSRSNREDLCGRRLSKRRGERDIGGHFATRAGEPVQVR